MRRLAIAQAPAFPDAVAEYWRRGPASTIELLTVHLERMTVAGELRVTNAREASSQLAYALVGPFQDRALLLPDDHTPTDASITAHVESTIDAFLLAYAP